MPHVKNRIVTIQHQPQFSPKVVYICDAWHTSDSMQLFGIYDDWDKMLVDLKQHFRRRKRQDKNGNVDWPSNFSDDELYNLRHINQTQGYSRNVQLVDFILNTPV